MSKYDEAAVLWDAIFQRRDDSVPNSSESGNAGFDKGLCWLCQNTHSVLDFGCGNGTVLFLCSLYGTEQHIGIDLSEQAIRNATKRSLHMKRGAFDFRRGGIEALRLLPDASMEAVVLSNIVDNLFPEDARMVAAEVKRILVENGKVFVKLNPFLTEAEIQEYGLTVIQDNVLDDGFVLWNNSTDQWHDFFQAYFTVFEQYDIVYPKAQQSNRVFLLTK